MTSICAVRFNILLSLIRQMWLRAASKSGSYPENQHRNPHINKQINGSRPEKVTKNSHK